MNSTAKKVCALFTALLCSQSFAADYEIKLLDNYHFSVTDKTLYWELGKLDTDGNISWRVDLPKDATLNVGPVFMSSYVDEQFDVIDEDSVPISSDALRTWTEAFSIEENIDIQQPEDEHPFSIKFHLAFAASFDDQGLIEKYFDGYYPPLKAYLNGEEVTLKDNDAVTDLFRDAANSMAEFMNGDRLMLMGLANYWILGFPPAQSESPYLTAHFLKHQAVPLTLANPDEVAHPFPYQNHNEGSGLFNRLLVGIKDEDPSANYKVICHSFEGCAYAHRDDIDSRAAMYILFKRGTLEVAEIYLFTAEED